MLTYLVAFVLSAICSVALTPIVRGLAVRRGLVDDPSGARKVHEAPIPRIGGVALAVAFFVPVLGLVFVDNKISLAYLGDPWRVGALVGGAALILGLGLWDDVRGLSARYKFSIEVVVALGAWWAGYRIVSVASPFGDPIALGLLSLPVTVVWIVGIVNAINLIDGLDGLATGISLVAVLTLFALGVTRDNPVVGLTSIALAGALVGFLRYNFNPATIFMGDSGSLFLGYVLAVTSISGSAKSSTVVALLVPLLALGLPVMDTLFTIARRVLAGRPIFGADREHVHHKLLDLGLTHRQVVLVLYVVCGVLALGALGLQYANSAQAAAILAAFSVLVVAASQGLGYARLSELPRQVRYGMLRTQHLRGHLSEAERSASAIRGATSIDEALDAVVSLAAAVGADGLQVRLSIGEPGDPQHFERRWPDADRASDLEEPVFDLERSLDGALGRVVATGRLVFRWHCEDRLLQIPEAPVYDWIGLLLRDRALELTARPDAADEDQRSRGAPEAGS